MHFQRKKLGNSAKLGAGNKINENKLRFRELAKV